MPLYEDIFKAALALVFVYCTNVFTYILLLFLLQGYGGNRGGGYGGGGYGGGYGGQVHLFTVWGLLSRLLVYGWVMSCYLLHISASQLDEGCIRGRMMCHSASIVER